jgi:hypothetical protein
MTYETERALARVRAHGLRRDADRLQDVEPIQARELRASVTCLAVLWELEGFP